MRSPKINIVFIGSSVTGLKTLAESRFFLIRDVLCLKERVTEELSETAITYGYELKTFAWIKDFRDKILEYDRQIPFLIYQLDMLVPADLTAKYKFFNLHRGSLYTNRGPTPDIWPILNGEKETCLTLHQINEKIDAGVLIETHAVPIEGDDDPASVKKKLEVGLPFLISKLAEYLQGNLHGVDIKNGQYRPWVQEEDFTISPAIDSLESVDRKIRSQRPYNGAIVSINNKKIFVTEIMESQERKNTKGDMPILKKDRLIIPIDGYILTLKVNRHPKYQLPPRRPHSKRI